MFICIKGRCSSYCFLHRLGMDWCLDSRGYAIIEANSPRKGKYECNQVLKSPRVMTPSGWGISTVARWCFPVVSLDGNLDVSWASEDASRTFVPVTM